MAENVKAISEKYKPNFDHYVDYAFKYLRSLIRVIFDMDATLNKRIILKYRMHYACTTLHVHIRIGLQPYTYMSRSTYTYKRTYIRSYVIHLHE